jgi:hypothetical protein
LNRGSMGVVLSCCCLLAGLDKHEMPAVRFL